MSTPSKATQYWIGTILAVIGLAVTVWIAKINHAPALPPVPASSYIWGDRETFSIDSALTCGEPENDGTKHQCPWYQWTLTPRAKHSRFDLSIAVDARASRTSKWQGSPNVLTAGKIVFDCDDGPRIANSDKWEMTAENSQLNVEHRFTAKTSCDAFGKPIKVFLFAEPTGGNSMLGHGGFIRYQEVSLEN